MTAKNPANPTSRPLFELLTARGLTVSAVARTAGISEGICAPTAIPRGVG